MPDLASQDRWFARVVEAAGNLDRNDLGPKPDLVARLMSQAERGDGYEPPKANVTSESAPGAHGPIPVRVYEPVDTAANQPMLVWCHGGGFLGGDLDMPEADATAREICTRAGAVVVSVDYRLAVNGVHYPVPHDDVVAAVRWARDQAAALGADESRISLGGASAGANLAAGACLRLREDGDRMPAALLLVYPALHAILPTPSDELATKLAVLPRVLAFAPEIYEPLVENYLGAPAAEADAYAMPGGGDPRGLPPTLVVNCEYDGLRASGEAFAAALDAAGVQVLQLLARDVLHGHINSPWLLQARQTYDDMAVWVRRATG